MTTKNDRFLRALAREPVDMTPIWIMRQAGRYLPEYRELRAKAKEFLVLCKTPELACQATLQPLHRFDLDAAIIFSDILTIPDAMGLGLYFENGEGPRFSSPIRSLDSIVQLPIPDMDSDLGYVMDAIRLVTRELAGKVPLIGFSGSPWTLATYMVEGASSKQFQLIKKLMFTDPHALNLLLDKLVTAISLYLKAQVAAGVEALMIFDTWGGVLTTRDYELYSLSPMKKIIADLKQDNPHIPIILFTKNASQWLESMANSGADALGLDWTFEIGQARHRVGDKVALQGNMDPSILYASPQRIHEEVREILTSYGQGPGHIFNLGHGIHPDIAPENVEVLIDAVHKLSRDLHE